METGTEKKAKNQKTKDLLDDETVAKVVDRFWGVSDREKVLAKNKEIGPEDFHQWGSKNSIVDRSPTLKSLKSLGDLENEKDMKQSFNKVLAELKLEYTIQAFKTFNQCDKAVVYEVHSVPRWSFHGLGSTEEQAIANAAKKGLEFFLALS